LSILLVLMFECKTKSERHGIGDEIIKHWRKSWLLREILGISTCNALKCPHGQCKEQSNGQMKCECQQCLAIYSDQEKLCGNNGITYS
jgi:hypothetical protein